MDEQERTVWEVLQCIIVGLIWGSTNAFLERGVKQSKAVTEENKGSAEDGAFYPVQWFREVVRSLINHFKNWRVTVPFLLNQMGSGLYYFTLGSSDLSLAVPLSNSATLLFTLITSIILDAMAGSEETINERKLQQTQKNHGWLVVGTGLTVIGTCLIAIESTGV